MTEKLYHNDSYMIDFEAEVVSIEKSKDGYLVKLNKTAFYPTSGGQLFDTGMIKDCPVVNVISENDEIIHIVKDSLDIRAGELVPCHIDWERRRDNMQKHTGQHILSQAFVRACTAETVSARLGEDDSTIDLNTANLSDEDIHRAEILANQIVFENRPVSVSYIPGDRLKELPLRKIPDRSESEYRIIEVDGFDWSACGGTHCKSTGSVGMIKIIGLEKIRSTIRLRFLTGFGALEDYHWRLEQIENISNLLTRHGRETEAAVIQLLDERDSYRRQVSSLKKSMLPGLIEDWISKTQMISGVKVVAIYLEGNDFNEAKGAALGIINKYPAAAIIGMNDKLVVAVNKETKLSASDIIKKAVEIYGGKGGGSPQIAQGGGFRPEDLQVLIAHPEKVLDI
ncbi:MAG: hypothetical protein KAR42_10825 [candidate division Zixibacteria bacterium]|nr:hypothetical protein [candidate division Zixibacteria bacterium]